MHGIKEGRAQMGVAFGMTGVKRWPRSKATRAGLPAWIGGLEEFLVNFAESEDFWGKIQAN